eukprot:13230223-Alexandrium_andersonii.AAC.1
MHIIVHAHCVSQRASGRVWPARAACSGALTSLPRSLVQRCTSALALGHASTGTSAWPASPP